MQVCGVVGPTDEAAALVEQLRDALAERGAVALVEADGEVTGRGDGAAEVHRVGEAGWVAEGGDRDLDDVLADLAPRVDYALLRGFPDADVPTVVLGAAPVEGNPVLEAPDAGVVDVADLVETVESAEPYETLESLVADVKRSADATYSGAIATFTGRVREREDAADDPTEYLEFEKHDGVAEQKMADIAADLEAREGIYDVRLYHKSGVVEAGEDIVHVVILAGHRAEAFAAVEDGIDRLKAEVPLFKKEVTASAEFWAHEDRPE
jgi:molybdopterin synthase catalytic subunit